MADEQNFTADVLHQETFIVHLVSGESWAHSTGSHSMPRVPVPLPLVATGTNKPPM